jgi:signal transduction histidine kinase
VSLASELGATFLFESLSAEQLDGLAALGTEVRFDAGQTIFVQGNAAEYLWVLLAGEMQLERVVGGQSVGLNTSSRPGTYAGGVQALAGSTEASGYRGTARTLQPSRFFRLPSADFGRLLDEWSPVAKHFLDGYIQRLEDLQGTLRQRERLISLGSMAAGLAHEVNNPAAAALRANASLRGSVQQLEDTLHLMAESRLSADGAHEVLELRATMRGAMRPSVRSAIEQANLEDEIGTWLQEHGVDDPWQVATSVAAAGLDTAWLEGSAQRLGEDELGPGLTWIAASLTANSLLDQVDEALGRIAGLVSAMKEYSYLDRALERDVDLHDGIEKTLLVLGHKLGAVEIVREYEAQLPSIQANGAELNQVWTNLLDNAIDAVSGVGRVVIRTRRTESGVVVEIEDNGPGIPEDVRSRIFDPFFTTKGVGKGAGLGLDIVRRIVVEGHHGEVDVESRPGCTCFSVRLPAAQIS